MHPDPAAAPSFLLPRRAVVALTAVVAVVLVTGLLTRFVFVDGVATAHVASKANRAAASAGVTTETSTTTTVVQEVAPEQKTGPGYRLVGRDGGVFSYGWFADGGAGVGLSGSIVAAEQAAGEGYWLAGAEGGVYALNGAPYFGSPAELGVTDRITAMAATSSGQGYWLTGENGAVYAFGDAAYAGSASEAGVACTATGVAGQKSGSGYWVLCRDGAVLAFGGAEFFGAAAEHALVSPTTAIESSSTGKGYWVTTNDGGVFAFGDSPFVGSIAEEKPAAPVIDMAVSPSGHGYWLVGNDGGVFAFGDAQFFGTTARKKLNAPVVGVVAGVGSTEPAPVSMEPEIVPPPAPATTAAPRPTSPPPTVRPIVTPQVATKGKAHRAELGSDDQTPLDGQTGWDISWPQCDGAKPPDDGGWAIIGVTGGRAFKYNRCLGEQWKWATNGRAAGVYINVNFPRGEHELSRGYSSVHQPECNGAISCIAWNFGWNGAQDALAYAAANDVKVPFVWLDVEQLNYWAPQPELNAVVIRGAIEAVRSAGMEVGIYSTPYQWKKIAGAEAPGVPVWTAGAANLDAAALYCIDRGFGGGPAVLVQLLPEQFDFNLACPGAGPASRYFNLP